MGVFDTLDDDHNASDVRRDLRVEDAEDPGSEGAGRTPDDDVESDVESDVVRIIEGHAVQFNEYRY